jgi:lipoprotein-releasing system ATP-binding protein
MNNLIFELKRVTKIFIQGTREISIFKDLNLSLIQGKSLAIIGQSGSGKSSLLHLMAGLDVPTKGSIFYKGNSLLDLSLNEKATFRNKELGFVYQFHHLLPEFTAIENAAMPLFLSRKYSKTESLEIARDLLSQVGLDSRISHLPGELSGGERQRVSVARALSNNPSCLIMDEPTGDLDLENSQNMFDLIINLSKKHKTSMIIATHDMNLASQFNEIFDLDKQF